MSKYFITTTVEYYFEVEADSEAEAEEMGWLYENYPYTAEVDSIEVEALEEDEEDE
jgi:hypothetical protein